MYMYMYIRVYKKTHVQKYVYVQTGFCGKESIMQSTLLVRGCGGMFPEECFKL